MRKEGSDILLFLVWIVCVCVFLPRSSDRWSRKEKKAGDDWVTVADVNLIDWNDAESPRAAYYCWSRCNGSMEKENAIRHSVVDSGQKIFFIFKDSPDNENGFEPEKGSTQLEMTFKTFSSTDNDLHLKFRKGKTKANKWVKIGNIFGGWGEKQRTHRSPER